MQEQLSTLTPEQREQFKAVKTAGQLDTFLAENKLELAGEEKKRLLERLETGVLPLSDEELDDIAGGGIIKFIRPPNDGPQGFFL